MLMTAMVFLIMVSLGVALMIALMSGVAQWSLMAFYRSVAKSGLVDVTPVADTTLATVESTYFYKYPESRYLCQAGLVSAAIANMVQWAIGKSTDKNLSTLDSGMRDQTGIHRSDSLVKVHRHFDANEKLGAKADNANNNQLEVILAVLAKYAGIHLHRDAHDAGLDASKIHYIRGTGTGTLVAGTWTTMGPITWSEEFQVGKTYRIVYMRGASATAYAARLVFADTSTKERPGVPGDDTYITGGGYYGDFGEFKGDQPPTIEFLASAGDTAENVTLGVIVD